MATAQTWKAVGEFSKLTQVSVRMLRYYDETGILTQAEVNKWTGHRLYSVDQILRLNRILYLRDSCLERKSVISLCRLIYGKVRSQNMEKLKCSFPTTP